MPAFRAPRGCGVPERPLFLPLRSGATPPERIGAIVGSQLFAAPAAGTEPPLALTCRRPTSINSSLALQSAPPG